MTPEERARRLMSGQWPDECVTTYDAAVAAIREAVAEAIAAAEAENTRLRWEVELAGDQIDRMDEATHDLRDRVTALEKLLSDTGTAMRNLLRAEPGRHKDSRGFEDHGPGTCVWCDAHDLVDRPSSTEPEGLPRSGPQKELKP